MVEDVVSRLGWCLTWGAPHLSKLTGDRHLSRSGIAAGVSTPTSPSLYLDFSIALNISLSKFSQGTTNMSVGTQVAAGSEEARW